MWMPLIVGLAVMVAFVAYVVIAYGWLPSLSESYYQIRSKWLFPVVLWSFAMSLLIVAGRLDTSILLPVACMGLIAVGAAPLFKDKREERIHFIGAAVAIGFGMASMWVDFGQWYCLPLLIIGGLLFKYVVKHNSLFWIEMLALGLLVVGIATSQLT